MYLFTSEVVSPGHPDKCADIIADTIVDRLIIGDSKSPGTQKRNFTHIDDIIDGLVLVGENGYWDEFGIGSPDAHSILDIAQMFGGEIQMLPERKGNRMTADVVSSKTEALDWKPTKSIKEYISNLKKDGYK